MGLVDVAKSFAGLVSPASLEEFNRAMQDLQATVGVALLPVLQTATNVVRDFGMVLLPVMQQLTPIVAQLAEVVGSVVTTGLTSFAEVLGAIVPLFEALAPVLAVVNEVVKLQAGLFSAVLGALSPVITVVAEAFKVLAPILELVVGYFTDTVQLLVALGKSIGSLIGDMGMDFAGGVKDAMAALRDGFHQMLRVVVAVGAQLAKLAGFDLAKLLQPEPTKANNEGLRPAENAQFQDFKAYGQELAKRSAMAGAGRGPQKTTDDWLKGIFDDLHKIGEGRISEVLTSIEKNLDALPGKIGDAFAKALGKSIYQGARNTFGSSGGDVEDVVQRAQRLAEEAKRKAGSIF